MPVPLQPVGIALRIHRLVVAPFPTIAQINFRPSFRRVPIAVHFRRLSVPQIGSLVPIIENRREKAGIHRLCIQAANHILVQQFRRFLRQFFRMRQCRHLCRGFHRLRQPGTQRTQFPHPGSTSIFRGNICPIHTARAHQLTPWRQLQIIRKGIRTASRPEHDQEQ